MTPATPQKHSLGAESAAQHHLAAETPSPMLTPNRLSQVPLNSQSGFPSPTQRPANAKHSRRISRNYRPPHSADGLGILRGTDANDAELSRASSDEQAGLGIDKGENNPSSPSRPTVSRHRASSSSMLLSLPIFADSDESGPGELARANSMRENITSKPLQENRDGRASWDLPSHHQSPQGKRALPVSSSMSMLSPPTRASDAARRMRNLQPTHPDQPSWSKDAVRRWSSSLPRGRDSAALAYRLAEGASPYLRAGIEELKSIFDVDSNPIPSSPFFEEDAMESDGDQRGSGGADINASDIGTSTLTRETSLLSADGKSSIVNRLLTASPMEFSSRDLSPTPSDHQHSDIEEPREEKRSTSSPVKSFFPKGVSMPTIISPSSLGSSNHTRIESIGHPSFSAAVINRRLLAWSLTIIAIGMTGVCAWGYAMQADTFSVSLIGFFLTQPAFALSALVALLLRKRALMDLFSRAMRAHVLAQALTVILAYLDLSASSLYVATSSARGNGSSAARQFHMVPTMEMRFGPMHKASMAGEAAELLPTLDENASMVHAHDSAVGDWRSRLTHLVVFLVQAAAPIVMALIGQYIVAQRLAMLARSGSLSRQSSLRQENKLGLSVGEKNQYTSISFKPKSHTTLPRLQIVSDADNEGEIARHRREQRRKRMATLPGMPLMDTQVQSSGQTSSEHSPIDRGLVERRHASAVHRHHRSVSHPVNVVQGEPLLYGSSSPTSSPLRYNGAENYSSGDAYTSWQRDQDMTRLADQ